MALFGIFLLVIGLVALFARETMWSLTAWSLQLEGAKPERNEWWDFRMTLTGVFGTGIGLLLIVVSFVQGRQEASNANATTTAEANFAAINATFAPVIPLLEANAADDSVYILPAQIAEDLGVDPSQVAYGRCTITEFSGQKSKSFYLVVLDWGPDGEDFSYETRVSAQRCAGGHTPLLSDRSWIELRLPDDYYEDVLATQTARPMHTATPEP